MNKNPLDLIRLFARHPVAANLLMLIMILAGIWSLNYLNIQFLPTFRIHIVTVTVVWPGANAEDVERAITTPIEQALRNIEDLKKMTSVSKIGSSVITLEFEQGSNMGTAVERVRDDVNQIRNLPQGSEPPIISKRENYEDIAKLILSGKNITRQELRFYAYYIEQQLLDRGISRISFNGLPEQQIEVQIPEDKLAELKLSLTDIAKRIESYSQDLPAGTIGKGESPKQLRSPGQLRTIQDLEKIPLVAESTGHLLTLGDVANIKLKPKSSAALTTYKNQPAVEMVLQRTDSADAFKMAEILNTWLAQNKDKLPNSIQLHVYDQNWRYIAQRIELLLHNGLGGFILILGILFLFLNGRVAFWVAMGIPVSFMAAMAVLYLLGGSINMVSLFAFIMTLGIIVDDTIVVGEEALSQMQQGHAPRDAILRGAKMMTAPIMASSLTTISAFLPLLIIGGTIGTILKAIPIVVVCVIIASVIECFLVLPGHLNHSFKKLQSHPTGPLRLKIDNYFDNFKNGFFRQAVTVALAHRWTTICSAFILLLFSVGLLLGGRIHFTFFPTPEGSNLYASVRFTAGTPPKEVKLFLKQMEQSLEKTNKQLSPKNKPLVETAVSFLNLAPRQRGSGQQYAYMNVELTPPDARKITNQQFVNLWRDNTALIPGIENFTIESPRGGPPGKDIDVQMSGTNPEVLKKAAIALANKLSSYPGVSAVSDDLPFGQEQWIYSINPEGKALGLTVQNVGQQLRGAFTGSIAQIFHENKDEIEVRVMLPKNERDQLGTLEQFPILTPNGKIVPLENVITLKTKPGLDELRHSDGYLTVHVTADVDANVNNANQILSKLQETVLPQLIAQYNIITKFEGKFTEQRDTLKDMKYGLLIALALIYLILAWVFASYGWPLIVMIAIPFGLTGALIGHWVLGIDLTILSLFGFFGLSGIVINDSIILLVRYKQLRREHMDLKHAIIEASCQRLRPVLLTSLTTIAGLTPLLFERSLQAQFLIPMAVSISFGLAFATLLILLVIPAFLSIYEDLFNHSAKLV